MHPLPVALALLAVAAPSTEGRLAEAPRRIFGVAWKRSLVAPSFGTWKPLEAGGPAVDAASGLAVVGTRDGWLHAFRPDGSRAWEFEGQGAFGAPPAIEAGVVYAGTSGGVLYAIDLSTGKARWRHDAKEELGTRPRVAGGLVVIASLEDNVIAVDQATGAWKWHHRRDRREGFTIRGAAEVAVRGSTVFAGYSDGFVAALDLATGRPRWERKVAPDGKYVDVDALVIGGGRLYAAAYSGAVVALDPETGKDLWRVFLAEAARLAWVDGALVAVTTTEIKALSGDTGASLWSSPLEGGAPARAPSRAGRWLVVPAGAAGLRFLDPATGRVVRVFDGGQGIDAAFAAGPGRGYALGNAGTLFALDLP